MIIHDPIPQFRTSLLQTNSIAQSRRLIPPHQQHTKNRAASARRTLNIPSHATPLARLQTQPFAPRQHPADKTTFAQIADTSKYIPTIQSNLHPHPTSRPASPSPSVSPPAKYLDSTTTPIPASRLSKTLRSRLPRPRSEIGAAERGGTA